MMRGTREELKRYQVLKKGAGPVTASKANNNHTHDKVFDGDIRNIINKEIKRQQENIILIAS